MSYVALLLLLLLSLTVAAAATPRLLASMILLPFKGCLLCSLLFPLLCAALLVTRPFPPLVVPLLVRTFFVLLLITSICRMSIMLMLTDMSSEEELLLFLRSLTIVLASNVCSLFLFDACLVFCAFTELSALLRAPRTSTRGGEAGMEGAVMPFCWRKPTWREPLSPLCWRKPARRELPSPLCCHLYPVPCEGGGEQEQKRQQDKGEEANHQA